MATDQPKQTITTTEAEFLVGYVFGRMLSEFSLNRKPHPGFTKEEKELLHRITAEGFDVIGKKTTVQMQMENEIERMINGEQ